MKAILKNRINGMSVQVHATTEHPDSHYGQPVWVDDDNQAYCQVGMEAPFYGISCKQMTNDDICEINDYLHHLNNGDSFTVELSMDGEYLNLYFDGRKILHDSANEDLYSVDGAEGVFESIISEVDARWVGVMKAAIEAGFIPAVNQDTTAMLIDAEQFLILNTEDEDCKVDIISDFWSSPNYLLWVDEDNNTCCEQWGEIISDDYRSRAYYRYQDGKLSPAKYYESEDADVYAYLDHVVDSKGQVWILLA